MKAILLAYFLFKIFFTQALPPKVAPSDAGGAPSGKALCVCVQLILLRMRVSLGMVYHDETE